MGTAEVQVSNALNRGLQPSSMEVAGSTTRHPKDNWDREEGQPGIGGGRHRI